MRSLMFAMAMALAVGPFHFAAAAPEAIDVRVEELLQKMTLEEKLGQLQQLDGHADGHYRPEHLDLIRKGLLGSTLNVRGAKTVNEMQRVAVNETRLGIPILFAFDVIHGYRTIFPVPLAETSTWDPEDAFRSSQISGLEAQAAGVRWTFAPMVDIARDPRWGRVVEGAGEDPYLGAIMARSRVVGFQGKTLNAQSPVMACAKHWVGYGAAEGGRDYNTTDISERRLREIYFPPFKAAVDAGVGTFMSAFNELNGVPTSGNPFTLDQVLRKEWQFPGFVVSDYKSVLELINHGVAESPKEAAQVGFSAGVDMEMVSTTYVDHLTSLIQESRVSEAKINESVRRILRTKFQLGLFDNPYTDEAREGSVIFHKTHRTEARKIAARSFVLLKNSAGILPLSKNISTLAVVGQLADDKEAPLGPWNGDGRSQDTVTILEGIRSQVSSRTKVLFARGCSAECTSEKEFPEAVETARQAEVIVVVAGESNTMSGEATSRTDLDLPGEQLKLIQELQATGKPVVVLLMNGRPLTINWLNDQVAAILEIWLPGSEAGNAVADVLFGKVNPGGKLPVTFPRNVGQIPIYYNHKNTGRPFDSTDKYTSKYTDSSNDPLYPFGFGLSYTKFQLSNLKLSAESIQPSQNLDVSVDVKNVGPRRGDEVVQLYIRDAAASIARPVKELKGFKRVSLRAGEGRTVQFTLTPAELGFLDQQFNLAVEPGKMKVMIGTSSLTELEKDFVILDGGPVPAQPLLVQ